jgi:hypothetical protein
MAHQAGSSAGDAIPYLLQSRRVIHRRQVACITPFTHRLYGAAQQFAATGFGQG